MPPTPAPDPAEPRRLRVFLCHASENKPQVRALYKELQGLGFDPWLDSEKLVGGQVWEQEIPKAVRESDVVLVCLSSTSISKTGTYLSRELENALRVALEQPEGTIFIVPLRLESCEIPPNLQRWQAIDYFASDGLERLLRSLQTKASSLGIGSNAALEHALQLPRQLQTGLGVLRQRGIPTPVGSSAVGLVILLTAFMYAGGTLVAGVSIPGLSCNTTVLWPSRVLLPLTLALLLSPMWPSAGLPEFRRSLLPLGISALLPLTWLALTNVSPHLGCRRGDTELNQSVSFAGPWQVGSSGTGSYDLFMTPPSFIPATDHALVTIRAVTVRASATVLAGSGGCGFDWEIRIGGANFRAARSDQITRRSPAEISRLQQSGRAELTIQMVQNSVADQPERNLEVDWNYDLDSGTWSGFPDALSAKGPRLFPSRLTTDNRGLAVQVFMWTGWGSECQFSMSNVRVDVAGDISS